MQSACKKRLLPGSSSTKRDRTGSEPPASPRRHGHDRVGQQGGRDRSFSSGHGREAGRLHLPASGDPFKGVLWVEIRPIPTPCASISWCGCCQITGAGRSVTQSGTTVWCFLLESRRSLWASNTPSHPPLPLQGTPGVSPDAIAG